MKTISSFRNNLLTREDMKNVKGGWCAARVSGGGITVFNYDSGNATYAQNYAAANGTNWCCDSCHSATWMQGYLQ